MASIQDAIWWQVKQLLVWKWKLVHDDEPFLQLSTNLRLLLQLSTTPIAVSQYRILIYSRIVAYTLNMNPIAIYTVPFVSNTTSTYTMTSLNPESRTSPGLPPGLSSPDFDEQSCVNKSWTDDKSFLLTWSWFDERISC